MARPERTVEGISVVLLGSFNPPIFQPAWFASNQLLRPNEAEEAKVGVIHPDATITEMGPFHLQVLRERFEVSTSQPQDYEVLRDLVLATFRLLSHTPVTRLGINWNSHYRIHEGSWADVQARLWPASIWNDVLEQPSLTAAVMRGERTSGKPGTVEIRVERSVPVADGLYVGYNDEYVLGAAEEEPVAQPALDVLQNDFATSLTKGRERVAKLVETLCAE
jgi:hypothetical protein